MTTKKPKEYEVKDHQLSISYLHIWVKLLWQNKVSPSKYPMVFRIWLYVLLTQPFQWIQKILFHYKISRTDITTRAPLFILGHWRSGTTHLHYILARDPQFAFLTNYQAYLLNVSLIGRTWLKVLLSPLMPDKRPQDNVKLTPDEPAEEEQPFANHSSRAGIQIFFFPKNSSYHDKYHLFKGIRPREKKKWKKDYLFLLKTIAYVNKSKPLLLKNPHNTGRVKELLELFPNGKYVFIHRNPYEIYQSMQHHFRKVISTQFLQEFSEAEIHERVLYFFETILQKYLAEKNLIPKDNLFEIAYADLENNPEQIIEQLYQHLAIPNYEVAEPYIKEYLDSVSKYEKNNFSNLTPEVIREINTRWDFAFTTWNYQKIEVD